MTTWADYVATGNAGNGIEFRFVIAGSKYEFVTSDAMVGDCVEAGQAGKRRVVGLQREGLGFAERAYLAGASLEQSIQPIRITETTYPDLDAATSIFSKLPATVAYLNATLTSAGGVATVLTDAGAVVGDYLHIGPEVVYVAGKGGTTLTLARGMWRTSAIRHAVTSGAESRSPTFKNGVSMWRKRRCWLYAHGDTELTIASTGTLIWQGVLGDEPELEDETTWSLGIESRWTLLDQEVASGVDSSRTFRGIYYPGYSPFVMRVNRCATSSHSSEITESITIVMPGFWETNETFGAALVAKLNAGVPAAWGTFAYEVVDGRWELLVTIGATNRYIRFSNGSVGAIEGRWVGFLANASDRSGLVDSSSSVSTTVAGNLYYGVWEAAGSSFAPSESALVGDDARRVPRTLQVVYGRREEGSIAEIAAYPMGRVYLDTIAGIAAGDAVVFDSTVVEPASWIFDVAAVGAGSGYIDIDGFVAGYRHLVAVGASCSTITSTRRYGNVRGTGLEGFRLALIAATPENVGDGSTPNVIEEDLASWNRAVTEAATGRDYLLRRQYVFHKGQRLADVIKAEAMLHGLFPYVTASNHASEPCQIGMRRLTVETAAVASSLHITGDNHITDEGVGGIRSGADGHVNVVQIYRGFMPAEDKYDQRPFHFRDDAAISEAGGDKAVLEIRPKVRPTHLEIDVANGTALTAPVRLMFGGKIVHVTVEVPATFFNAVIGDSVLCTIEELPMDGKRAIHDSGLGFTNRRGIVVGREWSFGDSPVGTLTLLIVGLNVAGYTPTARVASAAGATTEWTLTCDANRYAPIGAVDAAYFEVNDVVQLIEWDAAAPITRAGVVTGVSGNDITVSLSVAWAGLGGVAYNLTYGARSVPVKDSQMDSAYVADAVSRLSDGTTTSTAQVFAP